MGTRGPVSDAFPVSTICLESNWAGKEKQKVPHYEHGGDLLNAAVLMFLHISVLGEG